MSGVRTAPLASPKKIFWSASIPSTGKLKVTIHVHCCLQEYSMLTQWYRATNRQQGLFIPFIRASTVYDARTTGFLTICDDYIIAAKDAAFLLVLSNFQYCGRQTSWTIPRNKVVRICDLVRRYRVPRPFPATDCGRRGGKPWQLGIPWWGN